MRILVLTDRFFPEVAAPSVRIMAHARAWLEMGHEVAVVTCAPNFPRGKLFGGYRNRLYQEEWIEGIRTIRVWSYMSANEGFFRRSIDYVSFMISSVLLCFRYPAFDVILATSPPILTAVAGFLISLFRRRPWVFEIRDLWPASIRAVAASGESLLSLLERLELFLYRRATRILSLTNSFKQDLISRGIPGYQIDVVTNGVDADEFNPARISFDARTLLGVPGNSFLLGYIGTTGMAHGLETLLEAARICQNSPAMRFLIMGEGAERAQLEATAEKWKLSNVIFRDFVPHEEVPNYLAALDASIVHLRPDPLFKTVIPSKIFESMAMGVPILMAVEGEAAALVASSESGICLSSGDPEALVAAARRLASDKALRDHMAECGREAARTRFSRKVNAEQALRCLDAAVSAFPRNKGW